jgi:cyclopropane fatty-acyl-phospholipid synthase-like methyltransferase
MKDNEIIDKHSRLIRKIPTSNIIKGYKEVFDIDVSKYFENIDSVSMYQDIEIGYKYFYPFLIAGDSTFYEKLQPFEWYYRADKWEFDTTRKLINKGRLLEIGCGKGDFLKSLDGNLELDKIGIEHNVEAIKHCKSRDLKVDCYDLTKFRLNEFDYIVSFQVLEHLSNIDEFFNNAVNILSSNGKLIIGVPNTDSFIFSPFSNNYFENGSLLLNLPPHHMSWWNKNALKNIGEKYGLKLLEIYMEPIEKNRYQHISENIGIYFKSRILGKVFGKYFGRSYNKFLQGETILVVFVK